MGRKEIKSKLLMCLMAVFMVITGIFGRISLPVRAAEEGNYTVTFEVYEGSCEAESISVVKGESLTLPEASYEGHYLESWMDISNNEGVTKFTAVGKAGDTYTPERDMWLYANWKPEQVQDITVTFDTDGGKEITAVKVKKGSVISLPEAERDGHIFLGWYTAKEGDTKLDAEFTVTEDITLYAHWEKDSEKPEERPEATITFDADGGEMEDGDIVAKVGDTITLPLCTKDGYVFIGWYDNDICAGQAGEKYTVSGDVILKAHYEKKEEVTYLITFDPNGGRRAEHIRVAKGERIALPGTEKSGYVFLGWYTEKKGGTLLGLAGDELEVTRDMTVYALWEKEKSEETGDKNPEDYKAVFHPEGGTLQNETITIAKGTSLYLPLPEREGYDFTGWYLDQPLTQFAGVYRDSYRITKDTDFYAKWEKTKEDNADQSSNAETTGTYTVKYDANGGVTKESSAKVAKGESVKLPATEREGFTFKGWYTDEQVFIGMAGDTYKPDRDISLYAGWEKAASGNNNKDAVDTLEIGRSSVSGAATEKEPVLQTGRTSPIYLLAVLGMFGVLLVVISIYEGKCCSEE